MMTPAATTTQGAELKGRKFYWHQISPTGAVIPLHHRYDPTLHADVARQFAHPKLFALNAGTEFSGAIQFDNLTHAELGALLYALRGDGTYEHAIKIGKGKPRGFGQRPSLGREHLTIEEPSTYYGRLDEEQGTADHKAALGDYVDKFKKWTLRKAGQPCTEVTAFSNLDHIMDYDCLHNWSIAAPRYYPINFSDYSWLPASNNGAGETHSQPPARNASGSQQAGVPQLHETSPPFASCSGFLRCTDQPRPMGWLSVSGYALVFRRVHQCLL